MLFANLAVLIVGGLAWPTGASQVSGEVLEHSPTPSVELRSAPLALELDRAIRVLKRGLKRGMRTRDQYLNAFERRKTRTRRVCVKGAKDYVECVIGAHLRTHQVWDEGPPVAVEVNQTISEFAKLRNEQARKSNGRDAVEGLRPCAASPLRKVVLSPSVATAMLNTKVDPVYPADGHVSGTVVLHGTISATGHVIALRVISGNPFLFQSALEAARQSTYRPYRLNNIAVEFETTIDVIFPPRP